MAAMNAIDELKAAVAQLRAAAIAEGIEPGSTLGVWLVSQEMALRTMADLVEEQSRRIEERADLVERTMRESVKLVDAEVARSKHAIQETRLAIEHSKAQTKQSEEHREAMATQVAKALFQKIEDKLKDVMLVRQVQWNRRRNWSSAALVATIMLGIFVGGMVFEGSRSDQSILTRCIKQQVPDKNGRLYCPIDVVEAGL